MAYRQYIGSRYVPIFGRKGEDTYEWDGGLAPYEPLTVVMHQGNSFTSTQYVPTGIDINNRKYWAETGNWNAQIESYRQTVLSFDGRITSNTEASTANTEAITAEVTRATDAETANQEAITAETTRASAAETANREAITAETTRASAAETANSNAITAETTRATEAENALSNLVTLTRSELDEKIDEQTVDTTIEGARAVLRFEYDHTTRGTQGLCVFPRDDPRYIAVGIQKINSAEATINIYNMTNKTKIGSITGNYGHVSEISYHDNKLYAVEANEGNDVFVFDVTNPSYPSYADTITNVNSTYIPLCYYKDNKFLFADKWGNGWKLYAYDMTRHTNTYLCDIPYTLQSGLLQSVKYSVEDDMFILLESSSNAKITLFNTEGYRKTACLKGAYNFILCDEFEDVELIGGKLWLVNNVSAMQSYHVTAVATVFETDIYDSARYAFSFNAYGGERFIIKLDSNADPYYNEYNGNNYIGSTNTPLRVKYAIDLIAIPYLVPDTGLIIGLDADYDQVITINCGGNACALDLGDHLAVGVVAYNGQLSLLAAGRALGNYANYVMSQGNIPVFVSTSNCELLVQNFVSSANIGSMLIATVIDSLVFLRETTSTDFVHVIRASYVTNGLHV